MFCFMIIIIKLIFITTYYHKECFFVFVQQIDETVTGGKAQRYREKVATTKKSTIQRQSSLEL